MTTDYTQLAQKIASIARTEHAANVVVLDIKEMVAFTDYFVIASGRSTVQVKSIAERVEDELLGMGIRPSRRDGYNEGRWIVLDYNGVMAHIFRQEDREYYQLERLWGDAPHLEITENIV